MTSEQINDGLIKVMKENIPNGMNLARVLMDLLFIGKEAVYRRLRGEVPFTLEEVAIISGKLGISLDRLVSANSNDKAIFDLAMVKTEDPMEAYYNMLCEYMKVIAMINGDSNSEIGTAANMVPMAFQMRYELLSKFRIAKWMYQNQKIDMSNKFESIIVPDKLYKKQNECVEQFESVNKSCYILDNMFFVSLVNDIKYFVSINLISPEDVQMLKDEMFAMINFMSDVADKGMFAGGKEVQIYISNVNFEATYAYVHSSKIDISLLRVFAINAITSKDKVVFDSLKTWISALKKFSILITQSGEMYRIQFFNKQREIINTI